MNFFQHQDKARRKTGFLVLSFMLVILLIVIAVDIFLYIFVHKEFLHAALLYTNIVVVATILIGTLYKYFALRKGGKAITDMISAVPLSRDNPDLKFRQLLNVVDEISIASGLASPRIYYLPEEEGINAFVAGFDANDMVLVVTKGTLDQLNRDELQGVIAHEFSHIFNSDTKISLRLLAILGGLFVLSQLGYNLLRSMRGSKSNISTPALGAVLFIVGYIGLFFGNIIKSAISRQRELLSDASAVQFTRNPTGIGTALLKISNQGKEAYFKNKHSEDVSHMCFAETIKCGFLNPFSTHPKIEKRIYAIDPTGEMTKEFYRNMAKSMTKKEEVKPEIKKPNPPHNLHVLAGVLLKSIGNPTEANFESASEVYNEIPEELKQMTYNTQSAKQLVFRLIQDPPKYRMILLDMALPALKEMELADAEAFMKEAFRVSKCDNRISLYEACVLTILRESLGKKSDSQTRPRYLSFAMLDFEVKCIHGYLKTPELGENSILDLIKSLSKLRRLTPQLKEEFIASCIEIVQEDGKVAMHQVDLMRAISACLDCPMPVFR